MANLLHPRADSDRGLQAQRRRKVLPRCMFARSTALAAVCRLIASAASAVERANMHLGSTLRRRCARDHGAVLNRRRRRGYMRSGIYRSERAARRRLDPDRVGHLRASQRSRREAGSPAVDGLTAPEGIAIRHRHGIYVASMYEIEIASAAVENAAIADE